MMKNEIKEKIPVCKLKKTKYSGINLMREVETFQFENCKMLLELPDMGSQSLGRVLAACHGASYSCRSKGTHDAWNAMVT